MAKKKMTAMATEPENTETRFQWATGFHPPKGVSADEVGAALAEMKKVEEPSPENLYERTKDPSHPLHSAVWGEGDQVWASRGRLEFCARILRSVHEITYNGNKKFTTRYVEYVAGKYHCLKDVIADDNLDEIYRREVLAAADAFRAKLERYFDLKDALK